MVLSIRRYNQHLESHEPAVKKKACVQQHHSDERMEEPQLPDFEDDGYQGTSIVDVPFGNYRNQVLEQKYVGFTAHGHESDEDDYEMMGVENTDDNMHCFPVHKMLDPRFGIGREEYSLVCEGLQFVHGPAPISKQNLGQMGSGYENMIAACHHKKAYKVVVFVPKNVFPTKSELNYYEMNMVRAAASRSRHTSTSNAPDSDGGPQGPLPCPDSDHPSEVLPRRLDAAANSSVQVAVTAALPAAATCALAASRDYGVSYRFFIILYLGTLSKIKREFQQSLRELSKIWWLPVEPKNVDQHLTFEITFTNITSVKLKIPFRIYAQLQVVASTSPGHFTFLCQGRSMPFSLYSHSQQYGFVAPNKCPLCLQYNNGNSSSRVQKQQQFCPKALAVASGDDGGGSDSRAVVLGSGAATGFKDRAGNRKLYHCSDLNRFAAYRDNVTSATAALTLTSIGSSISSATTTAAAAGSSFSPNLSLLFIFPKVIQPGEQMQIAVHGTHPTDTKLFVFMDGEPCVVEFFRLHRDVPGLFVANAPMMTGLLADKSAQQYKAPRGNAAPFPLYIRKISRFESKQRMVNLSPSETSMFYFQ